MAIGVRVKITANPYSKPPGERVGEVYEVVEESKSYDGNPMYEIAIREGLFDYSPSWVRAEHCEVVK